MPQYVAAVNLGIAPWGPKYPKGAEVPADHPALQRLLAEGLVVEAEAEAEGEVHNPAPAPAQPQDTGKSQQPDVGGAGEEPQSPEATDPAAQDQAAQADPAAQEQPGPASSDPLTPKKGRKK